MRIGLALGDTEIYLRGDDLLDEQYDLYGFFAPAASVEYGGMSRGRTFLVGLTHRF